MTKRELTKIRRRPWEFGGSLLAEVDRLLAIQKEQKIALAMMLACCKCSNRCKKNDMTCATQRAKSAWKLR